MFKKLVIILLIATICSTAYALPTTAKKGLSWTPPTEYADGSPMPDTALLGYKIYWSTISGEYTNANSKDIGKPLTPYVLFTSLYSTIPKTGKYYYVITAYTADGESAFSGEVWANFFSLSAPPLNLLAE